MSDDNNIIREVEEEVRQDDYKRLWNKYKKYILSIIIISLTVVTSVNLFKLNKEKKIKKQSELFFQASEYINNEEYETAKEILRKINNSQTSGYSDLSFLYLIDLVNNKKINLDLKELIVEKDSLFYGLITLQRFNAQINNDISSIENISDIVDLAKPSSSWKYLAHELLSAYYLKKNDTDKALQSLKTIVDSKDSSEFIRERTKTIIETIKKDEKK